MLGTLGLLARAGIHVGTVHLRMTSAEHVARGAKPLEVEALAKPLPRASCRSHMAARPLSAAAREALGARPDSLAAALRFLKTSEPA
jgi:hypothetical protein